MSNSTDDAGHSCSYYCDRPECIRAQRDELVRKYVDGSVDPRLVVPQRLKGSENDPPTIVHYKYGWNDCINSMLSLSADPSNEHE